MIKGGAIIVKALEELGVTHVFGYPSGSTIDIYEALRTSKIKHVESMHEQGACHMADGYARLSGGVGVVIAGSGAACTNLITGIATAFLDSVPLLIVTGNVQSDKLGTDSFQEVDITGITYPITKYNFIVHAADNLAAAIERAYSIALSGRKGPVLVDVPQDVLMQEAGYKSVSVIIKNAPEPDGADITDAVKLINASEKPVLVAGGGVIGSGAQAEVAALAELLECPVINTVMGTSALPANDRHNVGLSGMYGSRIAAYALKNADLIITLGARFSDRFRQKAQNINDKRILQIDIDPAEIDKTTRIAGSVIGDIKRIITLLLPDISKKSDDFLIKTLSVKSGGNKDKSVTVHKILAEKFKNSVVTDVGRHQVDTVKNYFYKGRLLTPGGLGTMGYGIGAAVGAAIAQGNNVLLITGDGSFRMSMNEYASAVKHKAAVTAVVMNNKDLALVSEQAAARYNTTYETRQIYDIDYVRFAEAIGANGFNVRGPAELIAALDNIDLNAVNIINYTA